MVAGSINAPLNTPFYHSSVSISAEQELIHTNVAIDGHTYMIDVQRYTSSFLPVTTAQSDEGAEVTERSLNREGFWTRNQTDWSFGAGQDVFDDPALSDRRRYDTSKGIDPWTLGQLSLLPDTERVQTETDTNLKLLSVGGFFYWVNGVNLSFATDPASLAPTNVAFANNITDITTDGNRIYVAFGSAAALQAGAVGSGTFAALGTETPDIIEFANGRLIAASGAELYEISAAGVKTTIKTDFRTTWTWTAITGHPEAIFAAGKVNDISEFYATVVDDVGALAAPTFAGHLPFGETATALKTYAGIVLIGTSLGLRAATVANLSVNYGELIDVGQINGLAVRDRFCWFTWTNFDSVSTGIGRADLSLSTSPATFVPAYASDLMATLQGTVLDVTVHDGEAYFAVSADGVWGPTDDLVPSGSIETGEIQYSVLAHKAFTGVDIHHEPLDGEISAEVTDINGTVRNLGLATAAGSVESALSSAQAFGRSASLRLLLLRDTVDTTAGPVVQSWVLHALPRPRRIIEFVIPLILKTQVVDLTNVRKRQDPLAEVQFLRGLASSARLVNYQEGDVTYLVRVDNVAVLEGGVGSWRWPPCDDKWFELTCVVRLLSKER